MIEKFVQIFPILVLFALILILFITLINIRTFPRLPGHSARYVSQPVSILIPARNEAATIVSTLTALLDQDYPDYEILLLDDNSEDGTAELARQAAAGDPRLKVLDGEPLPAGWKGKNWACHQLSQNARGELLVFTDADVYWQPQALAGIVSHMQHTRAHLLTVWPTQQTETWPERLVVPLMAFSIIAYLPVLAVHGIPWPVFAAANGQCLAFSKSAYENVGGHEAVRDAMVEDMGLAYAIKRARLSLRMADGNTLLTTRMYHNWPEVRDGFAKNILAGHANNLAFLFLSTFLHWVLYIFPFIWLLVAELTSASLRQPLMLTLLGILIRALTAAFTRQRKLDALLMPVSVFLMTLIAARAVYWRFRNGPLWKGRAYGA